METNDFIRRAEDLAARCERTSSVTATAFLTPAERAELHNAPSLRGAAVVCSGGGTDCERVCAFFLPFYLTAEEFDPSEHISAVHFRSFFGEPGHRDYLGALLALGVRREWVGDIRIRGAEAWVFCLPSVAKTLAELDRAGRYTVRGEEIALRLGSVSLNYVPCLHPDAAVHDSDVISVRGKGKGTVTGTGGRSRKDRIFVTAERRV